MAAMAEMAREEMESRVVFPQGFQMLGPTLLVLDLTHPLAQEHAGRFADELARVDRFGAAVLTEKVMAASGWKSPPFEL